MNGKSNVFHYLNMHKNKKILKNDENAGNRNVVEL